MSDQVSFQISSISALFTIVQLIPRMSLRVTKCFFKCPARPNDLLHCAHLCNFSPVWIIMWILRWQTHSNPFLHCWLCAFCIVCLHRMGELVIIQTKCFLALVAFENMFCRLKLQHRTLHEMCPGNTKTEMGRNTVWKMQYCERTNWGRVKRQTGGGAKSALALNWIDLERFWQCKSLNWHLCESKKVCKYGATMHIEGSRSLWRKNNPSGGLRSPNPLHSVTHATKISFDDDDDDFACMQ